MKKIILGLTILILNVNAASDICPKIKSEQDALDHIDKTFNLVKLHRDYNIFSNRHRNTDADYWGIWELMVTNIDNYISKNTNDECLLKLSKEIRSINVNLLDELSGDIYSHYLGNDLKIDNHMRIKINDYIENALARLRHTRYELYKENIKTKYSQKITSALKILYDLISKSRQLFSDYKTIEYVPGHFEWGE